jgi:hypothetical protein
MPRPGDIPRIRNDPDLLKLFRLPEKPNRELEPVLYGLRDAILSGDNLQFILANTAVAPKSFPPHPLLVPPSRLQSSRSWSGGFLVPRKRLRFVHAGGRWKAPEEIKQGPSGGGSAERGWVATIWIGLDGQRRWIPSVPQIGTEHGVDKDGKKKQPHARWQWRLREGQSEP